MKMILFFLSIIIVPILLMLIGEYLGHYNIIEPCSVKCFSITMSSLAGVVISMLFWLPK